MSCFHVQFCIQEGQRGGAGGKRPPALFSEGQGGQECPLNGIIHFFNNFQFNGMKKLPFVVLITKGN